MKVLARTVHPRALKKGLHIKKGQHCTLRCVYPRMHKEAELHLHLFRVKGQVSPGIKVSFRRIYARARTRARTLGLDGLASARALLINFLISA